MKCFEYNKKCKKGCVKESCRYWILEDESQNCCLNLIKSDTNKKITLQDIGDLFNVTRMRICQIEKIAIEKIKNKVLNLN